VRNVPVPEPEYKQTAEDVAEMYWENSVAEIKDELNISSGTYSRAKEYAGLPKKTKANEIAYKHGVSLERVLYHLHHDALLSVNQMSKVLDVARKSLDRWFSETGVPKRGQSEAEKVKNRKKTAEERRRQTRKARKRGKQKYGDGGAIGQWVKENPEAHAKRAKKAAPKGTPAREENGMKGRTGQDHPNWRGGKCILDSVKSQLRPSWWTVRDCARNSECYNCGVSDCKLDVHHIIPIMAGGTNEGWNLMTLCESCHGKAEQYIRAYPEFDPVLIE